MVWKMFKIYGGRVHAVEAFMETPPLGTGLGWDRRPESQFKLR